MKRKDIRMEGPWVLVNTKDFSIMEEGDFSSLSGKNGHLMTKSYYEQLSEERSVDNECIINWELWMKIREKKYGPTKIEKEFKYKKL